MFLFRGSILGFLKDWASCVFTTLLRGSFSSGADNLNSSLWQNKTDTWRNTTDTGLGFRESNLNKQKRCTGTLTQQLPLKHCNFPKIQEQYHLPPELYDASTLQSCNTDDKASCTSLGRGDGPGTRYCCFLGHSGLSMWLTGFGACGFGI